MEIHICENCGNEHDGSYGSGRFCSKSCRCSAAAKKVKTRNSSQKGKHKHAPYGTWKCKRCDLIFETKAQLIDHNHKVHPIQAGSSWNKGLTKESDDRILKYVQICHDRNHYGISMKGKHLSEDHKKKTSESMKRYFKLHPDRVPYILNHSSKESYPEQYFREVFLNEGFPKFNKDKYVNGYFLDFAFDDLKVYIEVDGEQHFTDKNIVNHDKVRAEALNQTEWKCICRIRWSKFQKLSSDQKKLFISGLKKKLNAIII